MDRVSRVDGVGFLDFCIDWSVQYKKSENFIPE